jgi:hypothetical protein
MANKDSINIDPANQTTMVSDIRNQNNSPNPIVVAAPTKQDLNMTAPIHSDQMKNSRKLAGDFVSPNPGKTRENSIDYQTIQ